MKMIFEDACHNDDDDCKEFNNEDANAYYDD
jgi:hypothetical protein